MNINNPIYLESLLSYVYCHSQFVALLTNANVLKINYGESVSIFGHKFVPIKYYGNVLTYYIDDMLGGCVFQEDKMIAMRKGDLIKVYRNGIKISELNQDEGKILASTIGVYKHNEKFVHLLGYFYFNGNFHSFDGNSIFPCDFVYSNIPDGVNRCIHIYSNIFIVWDMDIVSGHYRLYCNAGGKYEPIGELNRNDIVQPLFFIHGSNFYLIDEKILIFNLKTAKYKIL